MIRFSRLALIALLASFVVLGCYGSDEEDSGVDKDNVSADIDEADEGDGSDGSEGDETSSAGAEMTLASNVYQDDDGVALCPVRGIAAVVGDDAPVRDRDGTTYYFC